MHGITSAHVCRKFELEIFGMPSISEFQVGALFGLSDERWQFGCRY